MKVSPLHFFHQWGGQQRNYPTIQFNKKLDWTHNSLIRERQNRLFFQRILRIIPFVMALISKMDIWRYIWTAEEQKASKTKTKFCFPSSSIFFKHLTFLLVEWRQNAVVSTDLEVNLLLHAVGDGTLRDNDADACLDGAQNATVRVEDTTSCCHHSVTFVFIFIIL